MIRDQGVWQWIGLGAVFALLGCSSGSDGSAPGGIAGGGAGGASAGSAGGPVANGGSVAGGGLVESGGSPASGGSGGAVLAGAGGVAGTAGQAPLMPLAAADDPSRISQLTDCALAKGGTCVTPLSRTKAEVCTRWTSDWPKHAPSGYTVPADVCGPAPLNADAALDAVRRVNLYRWLSALPPVAQSADWTAPAQACAVIQAHLPAFNHYPPATSACYTELGGKVSAQSLLAPGEFTPADAIDDLIFDWGSNNVHVLGHRWWLLSPGLEKLGLGFAYPSDGKRSTCVRVSDENTTMDRPDGLAGVVSYPSFGRVPFESIDRESWARPLSYPLEWSVSFPYDTDLSALNVRVYQQSAGGYEPVKVTFGANADFDTVWIDMPNEPMPPGTYVVLVSGTGVGDFGYRTVIDRCGADTPLTCDVVDQNCGVAGYACYGTGAGFCAKAGSLKIGEPCLGNLPAECGAGAACVEPLSAPGTFVCTEYCDPTDDTSPKACKFYCEGNYSFTSADQSTAYCNPHEGSDPGPTCDPLAPQCPTGQGCYDSHCFPAGTLKKGQTCAAANDCEGTLACSLDATSGLTCQPYCDPKSASSANACAVLCPNHFSHLQETLGVCLP